MLEDIYKQVAQSTNLPISLVKDTYKAYWYSIKQFLQQVNIPDNITEGEFNKLKTSISIPSLGKFAITWNRYNNKKKQFEIIQSRRNAKYKEN